MSGTQQAGAASSRPIPFDIQTYIASQQRDGRLLLRFVARRADRDLQAEDAGAATHRSTPYGALFAQPADIVGNPAQLTELMHCVDGLSHLAAPANVRSIRLTSAYLDTAIEDGEPPPDIRQEANLVRKYMNAVGWLAVGVLVVSIALLAHMDRGRRLLQQLDAIHAQRNEVVRDMTTLPLTETRVQRLLIQHPVDRYAAVQRASAGVLLEWEVAGTQEDGSQVCGRPKFKANDPKAIAADIRARVPDGMMPETELYSWREPVTQKALALCRRYDDANVRMNVVYTGLADWNCLNHKIFSLFIVDPSAWVGAEPACGTSTVAFPPEIDRTTWQSHEIWVNIATAVVAGFILPLLLGCLGGCAYGLRRMDRKLATWTLEPQDGRHALSRVALATLLGGLVGVVWTSGDTTIKLGGFTLSLAAAAFFIGFSVEGVFRVIENLINNVTGTLATQQPAVVPLRAARRGDGGPPAPPPPEANPATPGT